MTDEGLVGANDGRTLRRERNRDAVVQALLALYHEGNLRPSSDEIADRSAVSARSVFRYFSDVDDLAREAIRAHYRANAELFALQLDPLEPIDTQIATLVAHRLRLYEAIGNVGVVARMRAPRHPVVAASLARVRNHLHQHVLQLVAHADPDANLESKEAMATAISMLMSFESLDIMRADHGLKTDEIEHLWAVSTAMLLQPLRAR